MGGPLAQAPWEQNPGLLDRGGGELTENRAPQQGLSLTWPSWTFPHSELQHSGFPRKNKDPLCCLPGTPPPQVPSLAWNLGVSNEPGQRGPALLVLLSPEASGTEHWGGGGGGGEDEG